MTIRIDPRIIRPKGCRLQQNQIKSEHQHWWQHDVPSIDNLPQTKAVVTVVFVPELHTSHSHIKTPFFLLWFMTHHMIRPDRGPLGSTWVLEKLTHRPQTRRNTSRPFPT